MEVVVTTGAIRRAKLLSNHHHQQTNTQCFTDRMPFLSPNQQCQHSEGSKCHSQRTCSPQAQLGFYVLFLAVKTPDYLVGEGCQTSRQPSDTVLRIRTKEVFHLWKR